MSELVAYCVACGQPLDNPLAESHLTPACLERYFRILAVRASATGKANEAKFTALAVGILAGEAAEARLSSSIGQQIENGVEGREAANQ